MLARHLWIKAHASAVASPGRDKGVEAAGHDRAHLLHLSTAGRRGSARPRRSATGWTRRPSASPIAACRSPSPTPMAGRCCQPCGFEARWNGGAGPDAVEIGSIRAPSRERAPVSLFGQGALTFHVDGLFRTPAGWNLWVGGPPNAAKDGIAPLSGVIETDWSPYTFTMNWRFTRPITGSGSRRTSPSASSSRSSARAGRRSSPSSGRSRTQPDLKAAFEAWSTSRDALPAMARARPAAGARRQVAEALLSRPQPDGGEGAQSIAAASAADSARAAARPISAPKHDRGVVRRNPVGKSQADAAASRTACHPARRRGPGRPGAHAPAGPFPRRKTRRRASPP